MGRIRNLGIGLILLAIFNSCFSPPEYPVEPQIEFQSIKFKDVANAGDADSLILTLRFKDGDGDLGLQESDTATFKYANKYFFKLLANGTNQKVIALDKTSTFITFDTKSTVAGYDTLPNLGCANWEAITLNGKKQTVYFQLNPNHYNIFVDFYVKNGNGTFTKFDPKEVFAYPNCVVNLFNGRFPILSKDPSKESPLEGTIRYSMRSTGFNLFFGTKTMKLKVWIQDRALNKSESIETPEFTLQSIK